MQIGSPEGCWGGGQLGAISPGQQSSSEADQKSSPYHKLSLLRGEGEPGLRPPRVPGKRVPARALCTFFLTVQWGETASGLSKEKKRRKK